MTVLTRSELVNPLPFMWSHFCVRNKECTRSFSRPLRSQQQRALLRPLPIERKAGCSHVSQARWVIILLLWVIILSGTIDWRLFWLVMSSFCECRCLFRGCNGHGHHSWSNVGVSGGYCTFTLIYGYDCSPGLILTVSGEWKRTPKSSHLRCCGDGCTSELAMTIVGLNQEQWTYLFQCRA